MTIVCTGSIAYDYLMTYPGYFRDHLLPEHLDSVSLSFLVDTMVRQRGGTAPNIAYTLALLGQTPMIVGTVGQDFSDYHTWLESKGIDLSFVRVIPDDFTASFFANTDLSNAQIASFYTGAMKYASEISLHELNLTPKDLVIISPNDPGTMVLYVSECQELGVPYLYDIGQQVARCDPDDIKRGTQAAHCLFVNEYEYELVKKHTGLSKNEILKYVDYMVITLAEKGACIYVKEEKFNVPSVAPEKIVDPTGVGDAFRSGFLVGKETGLDWETCGQIGVLAATYCLEQKGTQSHDYSIPEFIKRYRTHFDDQGALDILLKTNP
jgi:adenosine kinase